MLQKQPYPQEEGAAVVADRLATRAKAVINFILSRDIVYDEY
jgi:hypothetical protein